MNTGHDGSMGTIHSNSPRECLNRIESMIAMGGFSLPQKTVREIIVGSVDIIIQAARLRDGSRRITHITEVIGMEGDVVITQDLVLYNIKGEDASGKLIGEHVSTGIGRPHFWERARYYGEEQRLAAALEAMEEAKRPVDGTWLDSEGFRSVELRSVVDVRLDSTFAIVLLAGCSAGAARLCLPVQLDRARKDTRKAAGNGHAVRHRPRARQGFARPGRPRRAKRRKSVQDTLKDLDDKQQAKRSQHQEAAAAHADPAGRLEITIERFYTIRSICRRCC